MDLIEDYIIAGNLGEIKTIINEDILQFNSNWLDYNLLKKSLLCEQKEITKFLVKSNFRVNKNSLSDLDNTPLHLAAELGWSDIVKVLLEKGASVNVQNTNKITPLQLCFLKKKYDLVDLMLPFDKEQSKRCLFETSHIFIACARNCTSSVKKYCQQVNIRANASSIYGNYFGYTPLHFAVQFQSRETVELLLKIGAIITVKDKTENTPLHLAVILNNESLIDLILLEHRYLHINPTNSYNVSHFHIACTRNHPKIISGFLQCNVNINSIVTDGPWKGFTPLHLAVIHQRVDVVKLLLAQDNLKKENSDEFLFNVYKTENCEIISLITSTGNGILPPLGYRYTMTPLFKACIEGDKKMLKLLISSGESVNAHLSMDSPLYPGATPLHLVFECNDGSKFLKDIVELLIKNGADVIATDARGLTPVHVAYENNHDLEYLMENYSKFYVNVSDNDGLSLFHIACNAHNEEAIDWFVSKLGVDVNKAVSSNSLLFSGYTPLHMTLVKDFSNTVMIKLFNYGANFTLKDEFGLTYFDHLLDIGSLDTENYDLCGIETIMSEFIKAYQNSISFDVNEAGFSFLHAACIANDEIAVLQYAKQQLALNSALGSGCKLFAGFTPLHFSVNTNVMGSLVTDDILKILLDYGADPATLTANGDTPLHFSINYLRRFIFTTDSIYMPNYDSRLFLEHNPFGSSGFSHFHIACQFGNLEMVEWYLDHGIDPNIRTRSPDVFPSSKEPWIYETGLHAALRICELKHQNVILLLLARGADVNARDIFKRTPLHTVVEARDNTAAISLLVESGGADVNARDYKGQTPLQLACRRSATRQVFVDLIENGADIQLADEQGITVIEEAVQANVRLECNHYIIPLLQHALRLKILGRPISRDKERSLESNVPESIEFDVASFERSCLEEQEHMKYVRLHSRMTLYDVLFCQNSQQLRLLASNENFQHLIEDEATIKKDFPIYGYLARLQYRKGVKRHKLFTEAMPTLKKLIATSCRLPDECVEIVFNYLTDEEVEYVKKAVTDSSKQSIEDASKAGPKITEFCASNSNRYKETFLNVIFLLIFLLFSYSLFYEQTYK